MNFKYWFSNFGFVPFKHWHKLLLCLIGKHDWPIFQYGKYDSELNQSHYRVTCAYCDAIIKEGIEKMKATVKSKEEIEKTLDKNRKSPSGMLFSKYMEKYCGKELDFINGNHGIIMNEPMNESFHWAWEKDWLIFSEQDQTFQVGDIVSFGGAKGIIEEIEAGSVYPVNVYFKSSDSIECFLEDGRWNNTHIEPLLKLVERPSKKVKRIYWFASCRISKEIRTCSLFYLNKEKVKEYIAKQIESYGYQDWSIHSIEIEEDE